MSVNVFGDPVVGGETNVFGDPVSGQIQDLNPTEPHLEATMTPMRRLRNLPVVGEAINRLLGPEVQNPNIPVQGVLPTIGQVATGVATSSPAALMREPQSYGEMVVKKLTEQVNPLNIGLGGALGALHKAKDAGAAVDLLKAAVASFFAKQGAETLGTSLGERTAGLSQPRLEPSGSFVPNLSFQSNPAATPSSERKGELDVDTGFGALMSLLPLFSVKTPEASRPAPPTKFTPNVEYLRQGFTPQDLQEMGKTTPAERQLVSPEQAQKNVDQSLAERVAHEIMLRQGGQGRPGTGTGLRLPGDQVPPERQLTYGGPPPEPKTTVVQRPKGEGQPVFRIGPQTDPARLLTQGSGVSERQIAPEAPLNWPDKPPGTGEGHEVRTGFQSQSRLQDIRPAVRTMDGKVHVGQQGDVHNDIITRDKIAPTDLDRRLFVDATGAEISRERLAQMGVPETGAVPGAHADELARQQKKPIEDRGAAGGNVSIGGMFDPANYKPGIEVIREQFKKWLGSNKDGLERPIGWSPEQVKNKAERAKVILSNPRVKPLESRPQYRAQPGETTSLGQDILNRISAAQDVAGKVDKVLLPIDVIVDDLDGGKADYKGPLMQQVRWVLDDDHNTELGMKEELTDPVVKLVKEGKLNKKNSERIHVYAEAQQEGGVQRMIDSGVSPAKIDQILKSMTPQELAVYKKMREMLDSKLSAVQKLAKELYGTVVNPVKNYFPRQRQWELYEPEAAQIAGPKEGGQATPDYTSWRELNQDYTERGSKAEQGFTVQRKPKAKTPIKLDAFTVYDRHMRDVAHFLAMQRNLKEIGEIVRSDDFRDKYGDRGQKLLVDWLNVVAKQGRYKRNAFLDTIRRNVARGIIAFRIPSQLVHLSNVPLAMERAGPQWYMRGQEALFTDEGQAFLKQHFREVYERGGGEEALQEATRGPITKAGFWLQREMDKINAQATVLGVYMRKLQEKGLDPQQYDTLPVDKNAVREARVLARRAVASPLYKDVPLALTKGGSGAKFFFQFQNTFLDQWSNIRYDLVQAGLGKTLLNNPKLVSRMALAIGLMALTETGIKYGYTEAKHAVMGRHPKDEETFSGKLFHELLRRVPGMGQLMSAVEYGEYGVPGADVAKEVVSSGKKFVKAESGKERLLAGEKAVTATAELAGMPGASQIGELVQEKTKSEIFKSHQKRLEEASGKPINKMTLNERVKAEKQLKQGQTQSRSDAAKGAATAIKKTSERGAELQKALDPKIQEWLDSKGHRIPGFPDTLPYQKEHLVLTQAETERYRQLLVERYNKFLLPWVGTSPTKERFSSRLEQAHAQARTQLLNEIRSNSIVESDGAKTKKRRFSFMGSDE